MRLRSVTARLQSLAEQHTIKQTSEIAGGTEEIQQNVKYSEATDQMVEEVPTFKDPTVEVSNFSDADLADFLSRPVTVSTISWTAASSLDVTLKPWTLYLTNAVIKKKLDNFSNLRCNLRMKFMINGTPFHQGRVLVSYTPLTCQHTFSAASAPFDQNIHLSQRQRIFLDPTTSQGGVLKLPFFWKNAYFDVVGSRDTAYDDVGTTRLVEISPLDSVGTTVEPLTITVQMWAEDVCLCVPTALNAQAKKGRGKPLSVRARSNEQEEENFKPSHVASAVAQAAGAFQNIPVIGPFAKATEMAATGVGDFLSLFGLSKPVQIDDVNAMRPLAYENMATSRGKDHVEKLTFDPKYELTIDPRTVGLPPVDEMTFKRFIAQESYIGKFTWSIADAADTTLYEFQCIPNASMTGSSTGIGPGTCFQLHLSSLAYLANLYQYWKGTLKFRFMIVASNFHRGRLAFTYDPCVNQAGSATTYPVKYTEIVDLASGRDFEIEIGWTQQRAYKQVDPNPLVIHSGTSVGYLNDYSNGILSVKVFNVLTAPNATDVEIAVFVSGGDDMKFIAPVQIPQWSVWAPQADTSRGPKMDMHECSENDPNEARVLSLVETSASEGEALIFSGEHNESLRELLKRYTFFSSRRIFDGGSSSVGDSIIWWYQLPSYGGFYGYDPECAYQHPGQAGGNHPFSMTGMHYFHYFVMCYAAYRGSTRFKLSVDGAPHICENTATREGIPTGTNEVQKITWQALVGAADSDIRYQYAQRYTTASRGVALTQTSLQPILGFESPFYSPYRFQEATTNALSDNSSPARRNSIAVRGTIYDVGSGAIELNTMEVWFSCGEDMTFFNFIGTPEMYLYQTTYP